MNITDEMIGEWQKRRQDEVDNMTEEEKLQHEEDLYISELLEENPSLMHLVEKLEQRNKRYREAVFKALDANSDGNFNRGVHEILHEALDLDSESNE